MLDSQPKSAHARERERRPGALAGLKAVAALKAVLRLGNGSDRRLYGARLLT